MYNGLLAKLLFFLLGLGPVPELCPFVKTEAHFFVPSITFEPYVLGY